jgi:AraC-like DNA-binding protein
MKLHIKHMVSIRCLILVKEELRKLGISYAFVELGEVDTMEDLSKGKIIQLNNNLLISGLELIFNKKEILVEKIKTVIIEMVHSKDPIKVKFSYFLSQKLKLNYTYMSNIFSSINEMTIEKFIIIQRIERVKELIIYNELNLTEISYLMNYSSVSHLSNQFKKITGLSPSKFEEGEKAKRNFIEKI